MFHQIKEHKNKKEQRTKQKLIQFKYIEKTNVTTATHKVTL